MSDIRGLKRVCASCATRFYDFNKSPILCPKCGAEFTGIVKVRTRRGRNIIDEARAKEAEEREDATEIEEEDDTVRLEDLDEDGSDADEDGGGDIDLEDLDDSDEEDDEDLEDIEDDIEIEKED